MTPHHAGVATCSATAAALPWVLVAVARERMHFGRHCRFLHRLPLATPAWRCRHGEREFLLAETGIGRLQLLDTLERLRTVHPPRQAILAGFSGALAEGWNVGDLVPEYPGALATCERPVCTPARKLQLGQESGAVAVDMESSHFIAWCEENGVPWRCVRAISDDVHTTLAPEIFDLMEGGRVSFGRLVKHLVRQPRLIGELWRLGRATDSAARSLAGALFQAPFPSS